MSTKLPSAKFRHGLVKGKFLPPHAGHSALIDFALARCDRVTVCLFARRNEPIPMPLRAGWLRALHPQAHVVESYNELPVDYSSDVLWGRHLHLLRSLINSPIDAVFTSELYGDQLALRLGAEHVPFDPARIQVPCSGSQIRQDPESFAWALAPSVQDYLGAFKRS